jgi:hypothetical protein
MNKNLARKQTESMSSGEKEAHMESAHSTWTSVPRDEEYEKRIFELECYIDQIEHQLVLAEIELNRHKREHCA